MSGNEADSADKVNTGQQIFLNILRQLPIGKVLLQMLLIDDTCFNLVVSDIQHRIICCQGWIEI